jgi:hypothetical protein
MSHNAEKLNELSSDELSLGIQMLASMPEKTAHDFNSLTKTAQMEWAKKLWGGTKFMGEKSLRILPVIGFIFSFMIALKNFVYGLTAFSKLAADSSLIGLSWLEILFPEKLNQKVQEFKNEPTKLVTLVNLTKYSKEFSDEGISFVANSIDFVKDIIFLFIDIGSFGWLTVGDISLSVIIMALEMLAESNTLVKFDSIITQIASIASGKIQQLSTIDFSDEEAVGKWFDTNFNS